MAHRRETRVRLRHDDVSDTTMGARDADGLCGELGRARASSGAIGLGGAVPGARGAHSIDVCGARRMAQGKRVFDTRFLYSFQGVSGKATDAREIDLTW